MGLYNKNMKPEMSSRQKKKKFLRVGITAFLVIGAIGYLLADRYLIDHVEIADVSAYAASLTEMTEVQTASGSGSVSGGIDPTSPAEVDVTAALVSHTAEGLQESLSALTATDPSAVVYSDDWQYLSDTLSISISKVETGSGKDKLTYFVADVLLSSASQLRSAFAQDTFGRNLVADTSEIARENGAIFAVNGDYYGFRTDGILIRNGVIYRDIPARMGLVFYKDGTLQVYDETQTSAQDLLDAGAWNTLTFGPALMDEGQIVQNLARVEIDTNLGNHPIQGEQPRTGVGIIAPNHFVFIVVDGRSDGYSRGVTLDEFAQIFQQLGCTEAYNLDGGGSSTMVFMDRVINNPLGRGNERATSDILYIAAE